MVSISSISLDSYWTSFDAGDDDLEYIINLLLDREIPLTTEDMAYAIVSYRLDRLEQEAQQTVASDAEVYLPGGTYKKKQSLSFPVLGNKVGIVVGVRTGENPDLGEFDVIKVKFEDDGNQREFAAKLEDHILNHPPEPIPESEDVDSAGGVMGRHGSVIEERLESRLEESDDIIRIAGKWFPRALVAEITEGHLNLAEAVLDVAEGGPLPTSDLLEHVELPSDLSSQLAEFSMDYALQEDDRFDEVGPAGEVLWYLRRLEPPEVLYTPPRLESSSVMVERSLLTDDLLSLEADLDDELNPPQTLKPVQELTFPLLFPHWRVGALPLSPRLGTMFPTAYEAPRIRVIFVDAHSGDTFPGWVVRNQGHVFGLEDWINRYDVPAGGMVTIKMGEKVGEVVVETIDRRMRNDWIRTVTIDEQGRIGFTMLKQPVGTEYDDLMVIGLIDPQVLDDAWLQGKQRNMPVDRMVAHVFRELAKLTPQSAVHARTLYAAVNVIQRHPPAVVFQELVSRPYYVHVGDLYWRFDPSAWESS